MSYATYDSYRDSGVVWLGDVPSHWEVKRLRFTIQLNPVKSELNLSDETLVSFVPMEAVNFDKNLTLNQEKPIDEVYKGYTYFCDDDVVLAKITPCFENGKSAIAKNLTNGVAFGTTELHVLRVNNLLNNQFLYYLIKSDLFMKTGEAEMYGAGGQKRVPENFIKNFVLGFPPLPEQTAIVAYLDSQLSQIDALIDKQQSLLEKLAEQRTATITQAVTKGLNPDVPMKDSGVAWLGEVPRGWEIVRLRFLCQITTGDMDTQDNNPNGEYPFYVRSEIVEKSDNYSFDNEAVLMAGDGVGAGKIFHYVNGKYGCHQRVYSLTNFQDIHGEFLYFYLKEFFKRKIEEGGAKSTVDSVRLPMLKDFPVSIPSTQEQDDIILFIKAQTAHIDRLSDTVRQTIDRLQEYRSTLITQVVTGKIKVV